MEPRDRSAQAKRSSDEELLALAKMLLGEDAVAQALLVSRNTLKKTWKHRAKLPRAKRKLLEQLVDGEAARPSQSEPALVLREADMRPEEWQALLKVRKVFRDPRAIRDVLPMMIDAIDSAARQVDTPAHRKAPERKRPAAG